MEQNRTNKVAGVEGIFANPNELPPERRPSKITRTRRDSDFLNFPCFTTFVSYIVKRRAEKALPLLLAIHRRLDMRNAENARRGRSGKIESLPLTPGLWRDAGNPAKTTRNAIYKHLRAMPDLVVILEHRTLTSHYRLKKGPGWLAIEASPQRKSVYLDEDGDGEE
jgi:hypothetical protein